VLGCKPEYERTITHTHAVPDQCTIFEFGKDFYHQLKERHARSGFFGDNDWHSTLVRTNADMEYLHYSVLQLAVSGRGYKLLIDQLVMQIVNGISGSIIEYRPDERINGRLKQQHLTTIETAKDYITGNFTRDLSLMEISNHCCVSPFHFSRLFKTFTNSSPHQYLLSIRLQHAAMLLGNSDDPVADIAFASGFNGVEHFTSAFRNKYKCPPARWRETFRNSKIS
jgi:AraC-like DNA-binding protein